AIRLNPEYATAYYNRGIVYERKAGQEHGDAAKKFHELAIQDYSQAIRLRPNYVGAFINRGSNYDDIGEYDRAIADFDEAIRLDPSEGMSFNNRCYVYLWRRHDYDRAIQDCSKAIALRPTAKRLFNRGEAYRLKAQYEQAISDL